MYIKWSTLTNLFFIMVIAMCITGSNILIYLSYAIAAMLALKQISTQYFPKIYKNLVLITIYMFIVSFVRIQAGTISNLNFYIRYGFNSIFIITGIIILLMLRSDPIDFVLFLKKLGWLLLIYGIFEFVTKTNFTFNLGSASYAKYLIDNGRIMSVFSHPIVYSCFLTVILMIAIYYPYADPFVNWIYVILIIINLIMTNSRTSYVALLLLLAIMIIKNAPDIIQNNIYFNRNFMLSTIIVFALVGIIFAVYKDSLMSYFNMLWERVLEIFDAEDTQTVRIGAVGYYVKNLNRMSFTQILFGRGAGASNSFIVGYTSALSGTEFGTIDNQYISFLIDYGLAGVFVPVIILIKAVQGIFRGGANNMLTLSKLLLRYIALC